MNAKPPACKRGWKIVATCSLAAIVFSAALPLSKRWAAVPAPTGRPAPLDELPLAAGSPFPEQNKDRTARTAGADDSRSRNAEATQAGVHGRQTAVEKGRLADALIDTGAEAALQAWGQAVLAEGDPAAIRAMMGALDNLNGDAGLEIIMQLIELSDRPEVFDGLARTISRMAGPETPQYLAEMHAAPEVVAGQGDRVLRLLGAISNPEAVPGLARLLYQPDFGPDVTGQAALSLGKIGNSASVIALAGAFTALPAEMFAQRQQILEALARIANPESSTILADLAANSLQPLIAAAARDSLQRLPTSKDTAETDSLPWRPSPDSLVGKPAFPAP